MSKALVWFRRDLRDYDHAALYHALKQHTQVYCVFVFDTDILDALSNKADRRVEFIWESVKQLKHALQQHQSDLTVLHGHPQTEIPMLASQLNADAVYCNHDYEPSAIARDEAVKQRLDQDGITFHTYKDQVLFEKDEVLTQQGKFYSVFTPYKNACLKKLDDFYLKPYPVDAYTQHLAKVTAQAMPGLANIGFEKTNLATMKMPVGMKGGQQLLDDFKNRVAQYHDARNFPAIKGPSYLSVHLRFGTVSIRQLARMVNYEAGQGAQTWLNELIWRDFYFQILHHRPDLAAGQAFKAVYNDLPYENNPAWFKAWCAGETGFPIVDAAMRQLNQTGYMHNRLRMVVASFLVKDLLIDWRWGERYFAEQLIDFDFSANNGGWQWAASTGCDAQPYFRIFNPLSQSTKFDGEGVFIRKYVPELAQLDNKAIHAPYLKQTSKKQNDMLAPALDYPEPIVDHAVQREKALALYKQH